MSEEKKNLNVEDLEDVAGGYIEYDPGWLYQKRLDFTQEEVDKINKAYNANLRSNHAYAASELKEFGIGDGKLSSAKKALSNIGVYKTGEA